MGYIEPLEFASLGLLAVAFVSMSSADLGMRKLAYDTIKMFLDVLEVIVMFNLSVCIPCFDLSTDVLLRISRYYHFFSKWYF